MQRFRNARLEQSSSSDSTSPSLRSEDTVVSQLVWEGDAAHTNRRKRTHITIACNACRSRKNRCSGDRPVCTGCQDRGTACVYDSDGDTTRLTSLKRKQASLEEETNDLRTLVNLLRHRPQEEVDEIVEGLRKGEDARTAVGRAKKGDAFAQITVRGAHSQWRAYASVHPNLHTWLSANIGFMYPMTQPPAQKKLARESSQAKRDRRMDISNLMSDTKQHPRAMAQRGRSAGSTAPNTRRSRAASITDNTIFPDTRPTSLHPDSWRSIRIERIALVRAMSA